MTAKVLVVEDEEPLALLLRYNLESEGFDVDVAQNGEEAQVSIEEAGPGPDRARLDAARRVGPGAVPSSAVRAPRPRSIPIIMLTARGEETDRVRGLATGADDYVTKPFSLPELMARVRAILRRARPERVANQLVPWVKSRSTGMPIA